MPLDPDVELLPDVPIAGPAEDLLERGAVAERLVELACAQPLHAPRVVGLVGGPGAGKTSILRLADARMMDRGDVAVVGVDAAEHTSAESLVRDLEGHLHQFFSEAGVIEATDAARDALTRYGEVVSTVVRLVGVKLDIAGAVRRSSDAMREEVAENAQQVGRRLVLAIDHVDRFGDRDLVAAVDAIRTFARIPYVTVVVAYDRRALALRTCLDPAAATRLVHAELAVPLAGRVLLARVVAGGLARVGARLGRDIDSILPLIDPEGDRALALDLIETPRDAKRVVNALTAALPLWPAGELGTAALDAIVRLLVPVLDSPRLDRPPPAQRRARVAELLAVVADHPKQAAASAAVEALVG